MKALGVILFLLCMVPALQGQELPDTAGFTPLYKHGIKYVFKTSTGMVLKGFVREEDASFVKVEDREAHETYELRKSEIISVRVYSDRQSYADLTLGENPHAGNYMFAQSALLFDPGKIRATSHMLLFENAHYAFTENWALTANTFAFYPVTLGIKCAYEVGDELYVGAHAFGFGADLSDWSSSGIMGYGLMGKFTRGNSNANFTVLGGVIGLNSDLFSTPNVTTLVNIPFIGAGYSRRINKRLAVNLEGWHLPGEGMTLAGFGLKLVGNEVLGWTFGAYTFLNQNPGRNAFGIGHRTLPIPYIGISRNF